MTICHHCHGTGDMTGQGYLDCPHCEAATERAKFEAWAKNAGIPTGPTSWAIYQHGKQLVAAERRGVVA